MKHVPIVPPIEAYRLDLERFSRAGRDPVTDAAWVLIGSFFFVLGNAPPTLRDLLPPEGERLLSLAFGSDETNLSPKHPYFWASELRTALGEARAVPDPGTVLDVALRMSGAIESAGLPILAFNLLDAAGVAFARPHSAPHAIARLFMGLGAIAERLGATEQAHESYQDAAHYAREAKQRTLLSEAQHAMRRVDQSLHPPM